MATSGLLRGASGLADGAELRRHPRIAFQSRILLAAPEREQIIEASVQNLSIVGALVTTATSDVPETGAEVICAFSVANEGRSVRGRVVWVQRDAADEPQGRAGAGIEFVSPGPQDTELLRRLIEPDAGALQPVDVWFEGMPSRVRCQAVISGQHVRLVTPLPFMRPASPVRLAFGEPPARGIQEGTVDSVMLTSCDDEGIPRLRLKVSLGSTVVDPAVAVAPPPGWLTLEESPAPIGADPSPAPKRPWHGGWAARLTEGWWPLALGGGAGALLVSAILMLLPPSNAKSPRAVSARPAGGAGSAQPSRPGAERPSIQGQVQPTGGAPAAAATTARGDADAERRRP